MDDTGPDGRSGVYVALWSRPRPGPGHETFPRSLCLPMSVDNHDKRGLTIRAEFEPEAGGRVSVPSAICGRASPVPARLGPGEKADGVLGFYIPAGKGRLILIGSHNFDWYVDVSS